MTTIDGAAARRAGMGGAVTLRAFIDPSVRAELIGLLGEARPSPAKVYTGSGPDPRHDEETRRTTRLDAPEQARALLAREIARARSEILRRTGSPADVPEEPQFLDYRQGDHFAAHADTGLEAPNARVRSRRISIVVFLSTRDVDYGGGQLVVRVPMAGPGAVVFPVEMGGAAGDVVAFRSTTVHEVRPVTWGRRVTGVTFLSPSQGGPG